MFEDPRKVLMYSCGVDSVEEMDKLLQNSIRLDTNLYVSEKGVIDLFKRRYTPFSEVLTITPVSR